MGNKKKIRPDSPVQSTQLASNEEALTDPLEEAPEPAPARIGWGRYLLEAIGVYTVAFLFMQHLQTLTKHVIAVDAYYHFKMAHLMREMGPVKDFVWTSTSVFRNDFSDSSFLYHLLLVPLTYISDEIVAIKLGASIFAALFCTVFYLVLRVNRCRVPFLFTVMIAACGSLFMYRMCQNRGYLLAMSLAFLTVDACINHRYKMLFVLAIAWPLSYTAFQVVIVIPIIYHVAQLFNGETLDRKLVPVACAGSLLGLLIHPNFPKDFYLWWVQNILVMWFKWTSDVNLFFGGELYPPELAWLTKGCTTVFLMLIVTSIVTVSCTRRRSTATLTWFGVTLFFGILTLASKRFIEYSAPLTLAYGAFLLRDIVSDEDVDRWSTKAPTLFMVTVWLITAACGGLLYRSYFDSKKDIEAESEPGLKSAALWLKAHAAKDDIVMTCDWDDFPQLFYYNTDQRYMNCLDPMFFYAWNKDLWKLWTDVTNARTPDIYSLVKLRFHAKWILATNDFGSMIRKCSADPRFRRVFADKDCTIFQLLDELPNVLSDWSVSGAYPNDRLTASEPLVLNHLAHPEQTLPPDGGVALSLAFKTWPAKERGGLLDLERYMPVTEHNHVYAVTRVHSEIEQDAEMRIGFDDGVTVWHDGKMVIDERGPTEFTLDGRKQPLKLPRGDSILCVRCTNYRANWAFMARLIPAKQPITTTPFESSPAKP